MNPRQALRIFQRALELEGDARAAHIADETAGDRSLRAEVERLLGASQRAEQAGFMQRPVSVDWNQDEPPPTDLGGGSADPAKWPRIDRYRLLEVLGEGGFGTVYRAEQLQPVQRVVALKLMRRDRCQPSFIRRFEFEQQTLARLSHPGIAQIYDAGTTADGDPYLAMEWVPGETITDYCDHRQLSVKARVAVMIRVCAAVQHAHQKGVIHRDLKPPNVLVAEEDGGPAPKVIDFGIARAADLRIDERSLEAGAVLGSPMYMSPEQIDPQSSADIDTRSDVYSLGVLIYELLCGATPFDGRQQTLLQVMQQIQAIDPPRPSEAAAKIDAKVARLRATRAPDLSKQLAPELDWIVLRAMEKRREHRYESAAALADDLQRYLLDQPVEARQPSRLYRLRKFVRRNRAAVTGAVLLSTSLLIGAVGSGLGFWRAQQQAERAQQTVALLQEFLTSPTPGAQGKDLTVLKLLEHFEARIDSLSDRPQIQADLLQTYAKSYLSLGLYQRAREFAERARSLSTRLNGEVDPNSLTATGLLGDVYLQLGDYARAAEMQERAFTAAKASLGDRHLDTLRYAVGLAEAQSKLGQNDSAAALHRYALAERRLRLGSDHPDTLHSINRLSLTIFLLGEHAEAERLSREAVRRRIAAFGPDHPGTLDAISDLSFILGETGRLRESAVMDRDLLERRTRVLGPSHRKTLVSLNNLAWVLDKLGEYDEAEQLYRQALETVRATLGDGAPEAITIKSNLGMVLARRGELGAAEDITRTALAQRRRTLGEDHPSTLLSTGNLVEILTDKGQLDEALSISRDLIRRTAATRGESHDATLQARSQLSAVLSARGDFIQAESIAREILPMRMALSGAEREATLSLKLNLALALAGLHRHAEAEPLAREVVRFRTRDLGPQHPSTLKAERLLARVIGER